MYNLEQMELEKVKMRQAVLNARAYKLIYVRSKSIVEVSNLRELAEAVDRLLVR